MGYSCGFASHLAALRQACLEWLAKDARDVTVVASRFFILAMMKHLSAALYSFAFSLPRERTIFSLEFQLAAHVLGNVPSAWFRFRSTIQSAIVPGSVHLCATVSSCGARRGWK